MTQVASGSSGPRSDSSGGDDGPISMGRARRCDLALHVDADVGGDAVEPRAHARAALEAVGARQARSIVSWTASSASNPEPSIR